MTIWGLKYCLFTFYLRSDRVRGVTEPCTAEQNKRNSILYQTILQTGRKVQTTPGKMKNYEKLPPSLSLLRSGAATSRGFQINTFLPSWLISSPVWDVDSWLITPLLQIDSSVSKDENYKFSDIRGSPQFLSSIMGTRLESNLLAVWHLMNIRLSSADLEKSHWLTDKTNTTDHQIYLFTYI